MRIRIIGIFFSLIFFATGISPAAYGALQRPVVRIGIVNDGPVARFPMRPAGSALGMNTLSIMRIKT